MAATEGEMERLMGEHEAVRAQMKFLVDSLNRLDMQSIQVKERIMGYCWALRDLRDAIRRHIELDERIFETLPASTSVENLIEEHKGIQKQVDDAIQLADNAVAEDLGQEELNRRAANIREAVNGIWRLIETHTAEEDRLFRLAQKDL